MKPTRKFRTLAILACCTSVLGVQNASLAAQARGGFGAGAQGRPADYLAVCKSAPETRGGGAAARPAGAPAAPPAPAVPPSFDARPYSVTAIPGVIAAGARWTEVWREDGNNADGLVGTSDGGFLFVQNDDNKIGKIDKDGKVTF